MHVESLLISCHYLKILGKYCDVSLGLYIVRGDNIVMMGEISTTDTDLENFKKITPEELSALSDQVDQETSTPAAAADSGKVRWDFEG